MGARHLARADLVCLGLSATSLWSTAALAESPAYASWVFNAQRAEKGQDLTALGELAAQQPAFARVWFYGQVLDLVTPGVPEAVRDQLRPRLQAVAARLAEAPHADPLPTLYLDRAANGQLEAQAELARQMQTDAINAVRADSPAGATLAAAAQPDLAEWVFYSLISRAALTEKRLGGAKEAELLLTTARRTAEGFALALDDLRPFEALLSWYGEAGLPAERAHLESAVDQALSLRVQGALGEAREALQKTIELAQESRGNDLMGALLRNGLASALGAAGQLEEENTLRGQVYQSVRMLQRPELNALIGSQVLGARLRAQDLREALRISQSLREQGPSVTEVRQRLTLLDEARVAFAQGAEVSLKQSDLSFAEALLQEASALATLLAQDRAVQLSTTAAQVPALQAERRAQGAELARQAGQVALRRGQFKSAQSAFEAAHTLLAEQLKRPMAAAAALLDRAQLALALGQFTEALTLTAAALKDLPARDPQAGLQRARAFTLQGQARLAQGRLPAAFANANQGLTALRRHALQASGIEQRAALHHLAGLALHSAGFALEARARLTEAARLAPPQIDYALAAAAAHVAAGAYDEALDVLKPEGLHERRLSYARACVMVRAGQAAEALPLLQSAPGLGLPTENEARLLGSACLAAAHLALGQTTAAQRALAPVRDQFTASQADPLQSWRLLALDARIQAAAGDWPTAARRSVAAAKAHALALAARPQVGVSLDLDAVLLPSAADLYAEGVDRCLRAAARGGPEAAQWTLSALQMARFTQALELAQSAPPPRAQRPLLGDDTRPEEAQRAARSALLRLAQLRQRLGDPALTPEDRPELEKLRHSAISQLRRGVGALHQKAPQWAAWHAPQWPRPSELRPPAGEARLYSHFDAHRGHLWLLLPDQSVRHSVLPTAQALAQALEPAWQALLKAPPALTAGRRPKDGAQATYQSLETLLRQHFSVLREPALAGLKIAIYGHGPLARFPLGALVLQRPKSAGQPPVYLASQHEVRYRLGLPLATPPAPIGQVLMQGAQPDPALCEQSEVACAPEGVKAEYDEVTAAFAVKGDAFRAQPTASADPEALGAALRAQDTLWWTGLVDPVPAEFVFGGDSRFSAAQLAAAPPIRARSALLTRVGAQQLVEGAGLSKLAGAFQAQGLGQLVVLQGRSDHDVERLGGLAARLAAAERFDQAFFEHQQASLSAVVDPQSEEAPLYHPFYWARLMLIEPAVLSPAREDDEAAAEAPAEVTPPESAPAAP